jgi:hypothetical protein
MRSDISGKSDKTGSKVANLRNFPQGNIFDGKNIE